LGLMKHERKLKRPDGGVIGTSQGLDRGRLRVKNQNLQYEPEIAKMYE
jgi:hypothetical protein